MNIIAIETSTEYLSLAVARDGHITSRSLLAGQRHAELLLDELDALLAQAKVVMSGVDAIAFGAGPGSFTGLRIACGSAQGLALACGVPLIAVGSLESLAQSAQADKVVACLDARMGEVYHGAYARRRDGGWDEVCPPGLFAPESVPALRGDGWTGCGSGFAVHGVSLQQRYGGALAGVKPGLFPDAASMLQLAMPRFLDGGAMDAALAAPLYVRDKVALKTNER